MDISPAPGGAGELQGHIVKGGSQLSSVSGVGQGRAAGKPGQAHGCFLPDMLVVAAEGLVDVEQEDRVLGQKKNLKIWSVTMLSLKKIHSLSV